ncbi:MAG: ABC transporter ATP-binding protein [Actinobacteria bacterium]|nr:ABC transporter ATP-binding protein [Actinomycetota bacterium]
MAAVIEVEALRKEYRRARGPSTVAVDNLDLSVPEGGVFGFLGPNGSGKTTTIRCLLGLVRPSSGRARMLGVDVATGLPDVISRVGSIVETPAMFPNFSGRRNLLLLGRLHGIGATAVDAALERVGLAERGRDLVKTYSLGMKQRLGLAGTLLKDPALLILDEPANGLDPAGIKEIRGLVRTLGAEGRTVFVSSHLLAEIQQTCDRVAILSRGRCVASGPVGDVLRAGRSVGVVARVADQRAALRVLSAAGIAATSEGDTLLVDVDRTAAARVTQLLGEAGLWVSELRPREVSLEDVFLDLTADDHG